MMKKMISILCMVITVLSIILIYPSSVTTAAGITKTSTSSNKTASSSNTKKIDISKYLVYTIKNWNAGKKRVELFDIADYIDEEQSYFDFSVMGGQIYKKYPSSSDPSIMNVYEFTERPSFAGKPRTITLSDTDLLPENLLKYNLQVGDTVITKTFTYEQDGNAKNGKEPIEWEVKKVQIIYTMYGDKGDPVTFKIRANGANISANYYLVAKKTLDYDEYFKFESGPNLYTGTALKKQKYDNKYVKEPNNFKGFVFDPLQGANIDFTISDDYYNRFYWNTCNTTVYTGMISIYNFEGQNAKSLPTEYALSKGVPTDNKGYVKYNWLYGVSPYLIDGKSIAYRGMSISSSGKLHWNHTFTDKAGYRPEMTIWTGIDTAKINNKKYDLTEKELTNGTWRKKYEINYDVWKSLENFVTWKIPN